MAENGASTQELSNSAWMEDTLDNSYARKCKLGPEIDAMFVLLSSNELNLHSLPFLPQDSQTPMPLIKSAALSATAYTVLIGLA